MTIPKKAKEIIADWTPIILFLLLILILARANMQTVQKKAAKLETAKQATNTAAERVITYETHIKTLEVANDKKKAEAIVKAGNNVPNDLHSLCDYANMLIRDSNAVWPESSNDVGNRPPKADQ